MPSEKEIRDATTISNKEAKVLSEELLKSEEAAKAAVRSQDHGNEPEPVEVAATTLAALSATDAPPVATPEIGGNSTPPKEPKAATATDNKPDFIPAVFIGWNGFDRDGEYFFPGIWPSKLAISKTGTMVPSVVEGVRVDPTKDPNFSHWTPVKIMPGDTVMVPCFNEVLWEKAVATREFAEAGWAERIAEWHDAEVDQRIILARVEAGDGLIKSGKVGAAKMRAVSADPAECEDCHSTWRPGTPE